MAVKCMHSSFHLLPSTAGGLHMERDMEAPFSTDWRVVITLWGDA
jgi:hypothetical protein